MKDTGQSKCRTYNKSCKRAVVSNEITALFYSTKIYTIRLDAICGIAGRLMIATGRPSSRAPPLNLLCETKQIERRMYMHERNDGIGESNILQNQFTSYLMVALRRTRVHFIQAKTRQKHHELPLDMYDQVNSGESLTLEFLCEYERLRQALDKSNQRELYIMLSKILDGKTFAEIAGELGVSLKTVSSAYYRTIARIKRELEGDD